jgi:hypothetical protein
LFSVLESELYSQGHMPLSMSPQRKEIESLMISYWRQGTNRSITSILAESAKEKAC